jgi:hypothetical protein
MSASVWVASVAICGQTSLYSVHALVHFAWSRIGDSVSCRAVTLIFRPVWLSRVAPDIAAAPPTRIQRPWVLAAYLIVLAAMMTLFVFGEDLHNPIAPPGDWKSLRGSDPTRQSSGTSEQSSCPCCPSTCRPAHPAASTATRGGRNLHSPTPLLRRVHPVRSVRSTEPARPKGARRL